MCIQLCDKQVDNALRVLQAAALLMGALMEYLAVIYQPYVYCGSFMCDFIVRFSDTPPAAPANGDSVGYVAGLPIFELVLIVWTTAMTIMLLQVRALRKTTLKRLMLAVGGVAAIQGVMVAATSPILWMLNSGPLALNAMVALCFAGVVRSSCRSTFEEHCSEPPERSSNSGAPRKIQQAHRPLRPSISRVVGIACLFGMGLLFCSGSVIAAIYIVRQLNIAPLSHIEDYEISMAATGVVICVSALIDAAGLALAGFLLLRKSAEVSKTVQWSSPNLALNGKRPAHDTLLRASTRPAASRDQLLRAAAGTSQHTGLLKPSERAPTETPD